MEKHLQVKEIKKIVNSNLPEAVQAMQIINVIASYENAIPIILEILQSERQSKSELVQDMNLELSRAHIYIELLKESSEEREEGFNKSFVIEKITEFYSKYKGMVRHCFNRF